MNMMLLKMQNIAGSLKEKVKNFFKEEDGMGTVEVILIIVGICIADKSRILCGNFRCI